MQNLARAGDNVVSSTDLYGGTWNLFANTMKDQGIEVRFVDPSDPREFPRATDARTRAYYAETLPNPKLIAFPIAEVAAIGRPLGIPLIMDNTAAPLLTRPFDHGAAIVVYSSTKYLGGHGTSIGGLIVDGGNFPWDEHKERQPALNTPDPSYHGAVWTEAVKPLGPIAYIIKARTTLLRDLGCAMSPFNAFLTLAGRRDAAAAHGAPLRQRAGGRDLPRQAPGGRRSVIHPSGRHGYAAERAEKYLKGGQGGLVGFEIKGGKEAGRRFIDALQAALSRRQYRRRALARHPSGDDHPFAALGRGPAGDRRHRRLCAAVDRHRAYRRHSRRSRSGAEGGGLRQQYAQSAGRTNAISRTPVDRRKPECRPGESGGPEGPRMTQSAGFPLPRE